MESPREKGRGGRGGGGLSYSIKLCSERLRPGVLSLFCTIFRVSSIEKLHPFHISASSE